MFSRSGKHVSETIVYHPKGVVVILCKSYVFVCVFLPQAQFQRASTLLRLGRIDDAEQDFTELVCT